MFGLQAAEYQKVVNTNKHFRFTRSDLGIAIKHNRKCLQTLKPFDKKLVPEIVLHKQ
jgi:hypothetical protein